MTEFFIWFITGVVLYVVVGYLLTLYLAHARPMKGIDDKDIGLTWGLWPIMLVILFAAAVFVKPAEYLAAVNKRSLERQAQAKREAEEAEAAKVPEVPMPSLTASTISTATKTRRRCMCGHARSRHREHGVGACGFDPCKCLKFEDETSVE